VSEDLSHFLIFSLGTTIVKIAEDKEGWSLQVQLQKMMKKKKGGAYKVM
jgi:hypothetical protein